MQAEHAGRDTRIDAGSAFIAASCDTGEGASGNGGRGRKEQSPKRDHAHGNEDVTSDATASPRATLNLIGLTIKHHCGFGLGSRMPRTILRPPPVRRRTSVHEFLVRCVATRRVHR